MGFIEIFLVILVAIIVIKPKQWPLITRKIAVLINHWRGIKNAVEEKIESEMKMDTLEKNQKRAAEADKRYHDN